MPHLDIVDGESKLISETSKRKIKFFGMLILWPLAKQSILFSSKTVFKFSIHEECAGL
jgi:hypothetical protein